MTEAKSEQIEEAKNNGLPVDSFRAAAPYLRRPFTAEAVRFKPQSTTRAGKTLCVAYVDARLVVERLNLVCPDLWEDDFEALGARHMICRLTVDGITRSDVGEGAGKALYSDALKRAAVKFGVGVSLYAIPSMVLPNKVTSLLPDSKESAELRKRYRTWLDSLGRRAFGEPLDHGDAEGATGDAETGAPVEASAPPLPPLTDARATKLRSEIDTAYRELREVNPVAVVPARFHELLTLSAHAHDRLEHMRDYLLDVLEQNKAAA